MSTYKWIKTEFKCDQCGHKHMNPDREEKLPPNWIHMSNFTMGTSAGSKSYPKHHFCKSQCLVDFITDNNINKGVN